MERLAPPWLLDLCPHRLALTKWPCVPKHTTNHSTSWLRVSNLCVCIHSTSRTCQTSSRYGSIHPFHQVSTLPVFSLTLSPPSFLSTRPTLWRWYATFLRSTQWSTTRLLLSSPSSSPTSGFSHRRLSAMNSLSFIYDAAPQTPNKVHFWRVKTNKKWVLFSAARQTSSSTESLEGPASSFFPFSLPVIPLSKSSSLIFPFLSLLRRRASFKSSLISSSFWSSSFGQQKRQQKEKDTQQPSQLTHPVWCHTFIHVPHRVSSWQPSSSVAPSCSFVWTMLRFWWRASWKQEPWPSARRAFSASVFPGSCPCSGWSWCPPSSRQSPGRFSPSVQASWAIGGGRIPVLATQSPDLEKKIDNARDVEPVRQSWIKTFMFS